MLHRTINTPDATTVAVLSAPLVERPGDNAVTLHPDMVVAVDAGPGSTILEISGPDVAR